MTDAQFCFACAKLLPPPPSLMDRDSGFGKGSSVSLSCLSLEGASIT